MDMNPNSKLQEYYQRFIELQDKLRRSEEERINLEIKFQDLLQTSKEEEQLHYRKLRWQYNKFLEEDRKRHDRNDWIITTLERIDMRIADLHTKSERINCLRRQMFQMHPTQLPYYSKEKFPSDNEVDKEISEINSECLKYDIKLRDNIPRLPISEQEKINSFGSYVNKDPKSNQNKMSDKVILKELEESFSANQANYIADEIMKSIHSRYYTQNEKNDIPNARSNTVQQNNRPVATTKDSSISRLAPKQMNSGYIKRVHQNTVYNTTANQSQLKEQNVHSNVNGSTTSPYKTEINVTTEVVEPNSNLYSNSAIKRITKTDGIPDQQKTNQQSKKVLKGFESLKKESSAASKKDTDSSNLGIKKTDRSRAPTPTKLKPTSKSPVNETNISPKKPVIRKFKKVVSGLIKNKKPTLPTATTKKDNSQENSKQTKTDQKKIEQKELLEHKQQEKKKVLNNESNKSSLNSNTEPKDNVVFSHEYGSFNQQNSTPQPNNQQNNISQLESLQPAFEDTTYEYNNQYYPANTEQCDNLPLGTPVNDSQHMPNEYYANDIPMNYSDLESNNLSEHQYDANTASYKMSIPSDAQSVQNNEFAQQQNVQNEYDSRSNQDEYDQQTITSQPSNYYEEYPGQYFPNNLEPVQYTSGQGNDRYDMEAVPSTNDPQDQPLSYDFQNNQQQYIGEQESSGSNVQYDDKAQFNEDYNQASQQYYENYTPEYIQQYSNDPNLKVQYDLNSQEYTQAYPEQAYDNNYPVNYSEEQSGQYEDGLRSDAYQNQNINNPSDYHNGAIEDTNPDNINIENTEVTHTITSRPTDDKEHIFEEENMIGKIQQSVVDILDTDTENSKRNISKVSNDSDSDFVTN